MSGPTDPTQPTDPTSRPSSPSRPGGFSVWQEAKVAHALLKLSLR